MGKRKFKGHDPAERARKAWEANRNPALWGTNTEALSLPQNADVHTTDETRTKTKRVQRLDCFATLKLSDHQFQAVRRYQADLAESMGVGDRESEWERVDGGSGSRELISARSMAASDRVSEVYAHLSWADTYLLHELSFPTAIRCEGVNWHRVVKDLRGLIDKDAQAKCVRTLSENVRLAYVEIDNGSVRRAA